MATAHALYAGLLAPVADLTLGKRLRVLAQGALATVPLHVLVTEPPRAGVPMTDVAWLARHASISILPSLDSLRLQAQTGASRANKPYFAVANPLLTGADGRDRSAFARERCNTAVDLATRAVSPKASIVAAPTVASARLRPSLDAEALRRQPPLPETADEVCEVASLLGAGAEDVLLGARASRPAVMRLARERRLLDYRVLHLASHGLVAGRDNAIERSLPEPAILLTPPASEAARTSDDTGLLTASDIAGFELDADWVVLSACNTAAGGRADAEALSGLARAFFHAGAKGLLVSHWEVNSEAAVRLVTRAFAAWSKDASRSRSDALASAMRELASDPDPRRSHPAYWAPFVVIGAR